METFEQAGNPASGYGKFKSAQSLLNAYVRLEAEFTKRCRRLKELEARLDREGPDSPGAEGTASHENRSAIPEIAECKGENPGASPRPSCGQGRAEALRELLAEEETFKAITEGRRVKDAVIGRYLAALNAGFVRTLGGETGFAAPAPVKRPATLSEAKRLADRLLLPD